MAASVTGLTDQGRSRNLSKFNEEQKNKMKNEKTTERSTEWRGEGWGLEGDIDEIKSRDNNGEEGKCGEKNEKGKSWITTGNEQ